MRHIGLGTVPHTHSI